MPEGMGIDWVPGLDYTPQDRRDCEHDRWVEDSTLDRTYVRRTCEDCGRDLGRES
jgi:hypothetical protein